jgi:hypothetical protein
MERKPKKTNHNSIQILHPQDGLVVNRQFATWRGLHFRVGQIVFLRYPFSINAIQSSYLPPTFAADYSLEFIRAKPVD